MTKEQILKKCFEDTIWMAIRYAHGRHTYAPEMVREAVKNFKSLYPEWKLREDKTIFRKGGGFESDNLTDLFE